MSHWSDPLVALLAAQPPETTSVTLTYTEVAALATGTLPVGAAARSYWWNSATGGMATRLRVSGWQLRRWRRGREPILTFGRLTSDAIA